MTYLYQEQRSAIAIVYFNYLSVTTRGGWLLYSEIFNHFFYPSKNYCVFEDDISSVWRDFQRAWGYRLLLASKLES